jgi:hypothetical protein
MLPLISIRVGSKIIGSYREITEKIDLSSCFFWAMTTKFSYKVRING